MKEEKLEDKIMKLYPSLIYLATSITHDEMSAEDCVSESIIKALLKIDTFDADRGKFSTWLHQIVKFEALNYVRLKKSTADLDDVHATEEVDDNYYDDPDFQSDFYQRVIDIINEDETLKKHDLAGLFIDYYSSSKGFHTKKKKASTKTMTFADMAYLSGLAPATVRSMFRRIRLKIVAKMESPEKEFENKDDF